MWATGGHGLVLFLVQYLAAVKCFGSLHQFYRYNYTTKRRLGEREAPLAGAVILAQEG